MSISVFTILPSDVFAWLEPAFKQEFKPFSVLLGTQDTLDKDTKAVQTRYDLTLSTSLKNVDPTDPSLVYFGFELGSFTDNTEAYYLQEVLGLLSTTCSFLVNNKLQCCVPTENPIQPERISLRMRRLIDRELIRLKESLTPYPDPSRATLHQDQIEELEGIDSCILICQELHPTSSFDSNNSLESSYSANVFD